MQIAEDSTFMPGTYLLSKGIEIAVDGVTLDGNGATLIGTTYEGAGIRLIGRKNVTIRNVRVQRFYHGIELRDCQQITIRDCSVRHTHEFEDLRPGRNAVNIWQPVEEAYGAAILAANARDSLIEGNDVQHQQNGISLYGCEKCRVIGNNASYNSGWGIHLHCSKLIEIRDNVADYCNRTYVFPNGNDYYLGGEAAGLLMVVGSCANRILDNKFRCGGDGVFVAGFNGASGTIAPCNNNVFHGNDCSFSTNNAFEATFCRNNVFSGNVANRSNYGFWLGYSIDTRVEDNQVKENQTAGVAIEHGGHNTVKGNDVVGNGRGVHLWTDSDKRLVEFFPERDVSSGSIIQDNTFRNNHIAVLLESNDLPEPMCKGHQVLKNTFEDNEVDIRLCNATGIRIRHNRFSGTGRWALQLMEQSDVHATRNVFLGPGGVWMGVAEPDKSSFVGNWWSGYGGTDADGDGAGDVPHPILDADGQPVASDPWPLVKQPVGDEGDDE